MHFYQFDEWEFYDLKEDPDELQNLYNDPKYAKIIKQSKIKLAKLREHYKDNSDVTVKPEQWQKKLRTAK